MKPRQLVMLVGGCNTDVPRGATGEIKDPTPWKANLSYNDVIVDFPKHPAPSTVKHWCCPISWLIPLNDPNADISDTTGLSIKDQVDLTYGS